MRVLCDAIRNGGSQYVLLRWICIFLVVCALDPVYSAMWPFSRTTSSSTSIGKGTDLDIERDQVKERPSRIDGSSNSDSGYADIDSGTSSSPYVTEADIAAFERQRRDRAFALADSDLSLAFDKGSGGGKSSSGGGMISKGLGMGMGIGDRDRSQPQSMFPLLPLLRGLPDVTLRCDPVINFRLKQRMSYLGACVTLGLDYLSDLAQWRAYCGVEDTLLRGRFSFKGSEVSWAKSWLVNLGMGEESTAKFKLRLGLNLKTYRGYARLRFRAEPMSCFDIGEGLSCAGKLPLPAVLPVLRSVPLRVEYRLRVNTPSRSTEDGLGHGMGSTRSGFGRDRDRDRGERDRDRRRLGDDLVSLTTGIHRVDISLDELNFCLEWDEHSPVWGIGLVRPGDRLRPAVPLSAKGLGGGGVGSMGPGHAAPPPAMDSRPK